MPLLLFRRDDQPQSSALSLSSPNGPIYIAGIIAAGVLVLSIGLWLIIRSCRRRSVSKREEARGGAFLNVRGVVPDDSREQKDALPDHIPGLRGDLFSRDRMTASIIMPDKASLQPNASRAEIYAYHQNSGTLPQPFTAKPFAFALGAGQTRSSVASTPSPDGLFARNSFLSVASTSRFSVISGTSSVDSTGTSSRKIRQLFEPVLPDELLITALGERLTVIQSFDDGWVLVGRENTAFASVQKSLFKPTSHQPTDSNVELGVIPAWCFIKPCKGLRAERPVRTSSLGITVQMENPSPESRDDVISWSNF